MTLDLDAMRADAAEYLIIKRDLYYKPNSCGYTGIRDHAGRYTLAQCAVEFPNRDSARQDGIEFIHEDDAPEFTGACFHDLKEAHLQKQRDEARATVLTLTADLAAAQAALTEIVHMGHDCPATFEGSETAWEARRAWLMQNLARAALAKIGGAA